MEAKLVCIRTQKPKTDMKMSCNFYWKMLLKDLKKHGINEENFKFLFSKSYRKIYLPVTLSQVCSYR